MSKLITMIILCISLSACGNYSHRAEWDMMYYTEMNNTFTCSNSEMKLVKGGC